MYVVPEFGNDMSQVSFSVLLTGESNEGTSVSFERPVVLADDPCCRIEDRNLSGINEMVERKLRIKTANRIPQSRKPLVSTALIVVAILRTRYERGSSFVREDDSETLAVLVAKKKNELKTSSANRIVTVPARRPNEELPEGNGSRQAKINLNRYAPCIID